VKLRNRVLGLIAVAALSFGAASCGDPDEKKASEPVAATLVLDYLPNGVHAGVYRAVAAGYYEDEGIDLKVITPTSTADTLRLIAAGKADFGFADSIDIAIQIDAGLDAAAIMPVTQRPSGGLITIESEGVGTPAGLEGKTVGLTGVPSDEAVFETIVEDAGGDPDTVRKVTIGFNGVQALKAGRIDAFTGYIPADATAIEASGQPTRSFAFDEFGGPGYPGLVAFSTRARINEDPELVQAFVAATARGYLDALERPDLAVEDLVRSTEGVDPGLARQTFDAYVPLIGDPDLIGQFDEADLEELSSFLVKEKLIEEPVGPERFAPLRFNAG